jgi:hypothetical protein
MMEGFNEMFSLKKRNVLLGFLLLALFNCSFSQREAPVDQWHQMDFVIDGKAGIKMIAPPAKSDPSLFEPQFISTSSESIERMFVAHYDPGWGRDRDLLLTRIVASITRLDRNEKDGSQLSLEDIKNDVYLASDDTGKRFEIIGEVKVNDKSWLHINLIGGSRQGVSYSTIVDGGYALMVTMSVYGDKADQSRLYQTRHETLRTIVNSVSIYTE